ncbi:uncharacterized protein LOC123874792 [Maniola jurtina]|uniref:uncharacterized protein LOC123874792 n=1 Tax=Maniola jurtina TaxID=191418 RepID=UPI001E68A214|nr:uncharacterized protein LOC123874792 [Maniola jurtina]
MEVDPPPEPPDPGENVTVMSDPIESPQSISMDSESTHRGTKRAIPIIDNDQVPSSTKKTVIGPSSTAPSMQSVYLHPSLSDSPKKYTKDDKGPFVVYVSREVSDPSAGASMRAIKFGQFLHKNKIRLFTNIITHLVQLPTTNRTGIVQKRLGCK